jgi:tetratricopeptide (TPR) repeat protein
MWRAVAALYWWGVASQGAPQEINANPEGSLVQAVHEHPESFRAAHRLGEFYVHENNLGAAVPYLEKAYKLNPDDYNNAYDLALAYLETGATESSRAVLRSLIRQQDKAELHNLLGEIEEKSGHAEQSAREYETAARMDPSETNLFDLGNELLLCRAFDPAVKVLTFAIQEYPDSAQLHVAFGVALYSVGQYDAALEALCRAIDLNPKDTRAFDFLGKMYDVAPQKADEVNNRLALFAREYPQNPAANFYYALSMRRRSSGGAPAHNKQAEKYLRNAVDLSPQWSDAHYELGLLYDDESRTDDAIREYRSAVQLQPGLAKAHYRLARLYQKEGQTQLAQAEFHAYETAKRSQ